MGDSVFTLDLYHDGQMVSRKGGKEYLGEMVVEGLQFELDEWSLQEIVAALKEVGYTGNAKIWELKSDGDAMRMGKYVVEQEIKHCHVYADYIPSDGEYSANDLVEVKVVSQSESSSEDNRFDDSADDGDHEDHFGFNVEEENQQGQHPNAFGGNSGSLGTDDNNVDVEVGVENNRGGVTEDGAEIDVGDISSGYDTESLDSYDGDSDEPVRRKKYPRYNEAGMSVGYEFRLGTEFKSIAEFKEAIKEHALLNGRDIRYVKNDQVRCRVKCNGLGGECPWMTFASKVGKSGCVRLKTLKSKHTCGRNYSGRLASSNWIAKKITNNISRGEDMKLGTVIQTIQEKYMVNISVWKAYWVRRKAREVVHGKAVQQYGRIRDYCLWNGNLENNPRSETVAPQGSAPALAPHGSAPAPTTAETSTTRSATVSQRGRGRGCGRGGSRPGKSRSATPAAAVSQPAPAPPTSATTAPLVTALDPPLPPPVTAPTPPMTAPAPPLPPPDPRNSTAPPVPLPADPLQPAPAPTRSTAPPLPKTKKFCVRRSGRLKIGVRKAKSGPTETVDLTAD
ncbi:hypothetical protein Ahy_B04g073552 [Arachis hypogaea]|uniref:Transposase MuDR plant domain-containing protein n=1 Tax=Arachis hypogaea TaxID=3818 RepID=A0A444ZQP3_ARAHY|nr:hypothetical protein Ahy_B04g073552 [Arachis hypogaea]